MSAYISPKDTAKLIRSALKESFPGIKFSVRSDTYAGGASIRVTWADGPNSKQVESVAGQFAGGYFDGMTDYKCTRYHMLDGARVRFGADFVFCERKYGDAAIERALRSALVGWEVRDCRGAVVTISPTVQDYRSGNLYQYYAGGEWCTGSPHHSAQSMISRWLAKHSDRLQAMPSPTLARLHYLGDDGYGCGATGPAHLSVVS